MLQILVAACSAAAIVAAIVAMIVAVVHVQNSVEILVLLHAHKVVLINVMRLVNQIVQGVVKDVKVDVWEPVMVVVELAKRHVLVIVQDI